MFCPVVNLKSFPESLSLHLRERDFRSGVDDGGIHWSALSQVVVYLVHRIQFAGSLVLHLDDVMMIIGGALGHRDGDIFNRDRS